MKLADIRNPVRFNWLADQGFRLDASPYLRRLRGTQGPGAASRNGALCVS